MFRERLLLIDMEINSLIELYVDKDISISVCIDSPQLQFSRSVVSDTLRPHELQHATPPCPSYYSTIKKSEINAICSNLVKDQSLIKNF